MSQASPRGNITQTLMTFAVIFLGFLLIQNALKPSDDPRTSSEILESMRQLNGRVMDQSIVRMRQTYEAKLAKEAEVGKTPKDQVPAKMFEAAILVAHTQYKGGLLKQDINRIIPAYESMLSLKKAHEDKPEWNQPITVGTNTAYAQFKDATVIPAELLVKAGSEARRLGRETPVWGFFPGFQLVDSLVRMTGAVPSFSYAFAALILALLVRAIIFPLAQRQMMWSRQMSQLSPLVNEIREQYKKKHGDKLSPQDQQEMNARMMGLYKEYGINPAAGCLPMFLQMPLFLLIYQSMLHYRFEFQNGVFLWISPGMHKASNGFVASNLGEKDYILIVLYGISFVITTLLTPVSDPNNARQQRVMGISISLLFSVMMFFWPVPSAFVLYWVFTNVFATAQSLRAYRLPLPPLVKQNAPGGGVYPQGSLTDPKLNGQTKTGIPKKHKPKKKN